MKFICAKLLYRTNLVLGKAWLVAALVIHSSSGATEIVGYPAMSSIDKLDPQSILPNHSSQQKTSIRSEPTLSPEVALEIAKQFVESEGLQSRSSSLGLATTEPPQSDKVVERPREEPPVQIINQTSTSVSLPIDPQASTGPSNAKNLSLPTLRYESDGVGYEVSQEGSSMAYGDDDSSLEARIGIGYGGMNRSRGISLSGAKLINSDLALGGALESRSKRTDLSINFVSKLDSLSTLSISLGHMWGRETFNFFSGAAETDINQSALALSYQGGLSADNGEVSRWGLSVWGARANQGSNLSPLTHTVETATSYDTYLDPRKLSEGRLVGGSLSFQYRQKDKFLFHPSLGYERLELPYADGTRETYERPTASLEMQYHLDNKASLKWMSRSGVAERRSTIGIQWGSWWVDAFYSEGLRGLKNTRGVSINYSLLNPLPGSRNRSGLASLDKDAYSNPGNDVHSGKELLHSAMARPSAFPRVWLAKVDNSAVTLIQRTAKVTTTTSWATTSLGVMYFDSGAPNRSSISLSVSATSNDGSAVAYSWGSDPDNLQSVLSLNTSTGVISGSHAAVASDKTYTFSIVATANSVSSTSNNFTLTIKAPVRVRFTTAGATVELGTAVTTANSITFPSQLTSIELLLVGGGGGGGAGNGGGGGAGAVLYASSLTPPASTTSLSIGIGGAGASQTTNNATTSEGTNGGGTTFGAYTALGGGGGGSFGSYTGRSGGNGGGNSGGSPSLLAAGGQASQVCPTGFTCLGNAGGTAGEQHGYPGGGGGGANSPGTNGAGTSAGFAAGNGGSGYAAPSTLGSVVLAGGGGGGYDRNDIVNTGGLADPAISAQGGSGVGGVGGASSSGGNATADTGSGGGGGATGWLNDINTGNPAQYIRYGGGAGTNGVIILRY